MLVTPDPNAVPLLIEFEHDDARMPEAAHPGDAAVDLPCLDSFQLKPGEHKRIDTGLKVRLPVGYAGLVVPRSGLASRHGITIVNAPGLIDPNYDGAIGVILHNVSRHMFEAAAGERIAQLLLVPFVLPQLIRVDELPPVQDTSRGAGGFGSSGR